MMSRMSSCMPDRFVLPHPRDRVQRGKRAIRHMRAALAAAMLLCPLAFAGPAAAQPKVNLEQTFADSLQAMPKEELAVTGGFYVPAYSSVAMSQGKLRVDFSVTLSVHNASETQALVVRRIAYFDTAGKQVESYLKAPVAVKPLATISIVIPTDDVRGGTGANFIVDWAATGEIAEPVVEALMVGGVANAHYAFISQGRPTRTVGKK
ncbi:DUF3124 domain-containing protein [Bradyrhizobium guangzhouense]|uniref:DUF3124 domain-containing protein n=2 Tax=Bradyrhizobium guangzhouense TaxID=1325095 RepID=A0AAE5X469_9BRAD|nr:hypothetical protein XH91_25830 [Bradyrhizobium guangzhouense]RXH06402.1 DUF3124 domain-containing protein [Bradyrhizobium guangzhouense]RXH10841.1 DUF3124 domain-containing protein [Bradyrhizobium guangzhouense]